MIPVDGDPRSTAHDVQKHPNPLVRFKFFDLSHETCKWPQGQSYLITGMQLFWRQQKALLIASCLEICDKIIGHKGGGVIKADEAGYACGGINSPPGPAIGVKTYENVPRKERHLHLDELAPAHSCLALHGQERLEALPDEIVLGNVGAIRLELGKIPTAGIVFVDHGTDLVSRCKLTRSGICLLSLVNQGMFSVKPRFC